MDCYHLDVVLLRLVDLRVTQHLELQLFYFLLLQPGLRFQMLRYQQEPLFEL